MNWSISFEMVWNGLLPFDGAKPFHPYSVYIEKIWITKRLKAVHYVQMQKTGVQN